MLPLILTSELTCVRLLTTLGLKYQITFPQPSKL